MTLRLTIRVKLVQKIVNLIGNLKIIGTICHGCLRKGSESLSFLIDVSNLVNFDTSVPERIVFVFKKGKVLPKVSVSTLRVRLNYITSSLQIRKDNH